METDASVRIRTLGSVLEIALHGTPNSRQLAANLVMTTGLKIDFQERIVFSGCERFVGQYCLLGFFGVRLGNERFVELFVARKPVLEACFRLFRNALDDSPIGFADLLVALEHRVKTCQRFASSCKEYYSTRWPIETMGYAKKDLARLVVFLLDIRLDDFRKRSVACLVALHDFVASLVDGNNMIIFV